jgi:hypothetical protein
MCQKQISERQIKVTTKPFVTELRRISQKFGGKSDYLYFCSVQVVGHAFQRDIRHRSHAGKRDLLLQSSQITVSYIETQISNNDIRNRNNESISD